MDSLGINFSGKSIKFCILNSEGVIVNLFEAPSEIDFSSDLSSVSRNSTVITVTAEIIKDVLRSYGIEHRAASISLDTCNTFINVIPVDFRETDENIKSRVLWDFSNFFPDTYRNYKLNFVRLNEIVFSEGVYNVMLIAMHKNINDFFSSVFSEAGMRINILDIDHFAAEKSLNASLKVTLKDAPRKILIGIKKNRIDISVFDSRPLYYSFSLYKDIALEGVLYNELNALMAQMPQYGSDRIYVYGEDVSPALVGNMQADFRNASFSLMDITGGKKVKGITPEASYRYAAAYGCALKGLAPA